MPVRAERRAGPWGVGWLLAGWLMVALGATPATAAGVEDASNVLGKLDAELRITGMTFVGSRGGLNEFVLRARVAHFEPQSNVAQLEGVRIVSTDEGRGRNFEVSCASGELNVETNDFLAEGDVRGTTGDGRRYTAPWVRYVRAQDLLFTDAPVQMQDDTGSYRGDGFRYQVKERRFRLLGNVSLVQKP